MQIPQKKTKIIISQNKILWIVFFIILLLFCFLRYRLLNVPLERDEGEYAYAGQLILQGIPPYLECFGMRPPGIYLIYALIITFLGNSCYAIHLGLLITNLLSILFIFFLSSKLFNKVSSLIASTSFEIFSISYALQGCQANSEHFVILFAIAGLWLLLESLQQNNNKYLFLSGIFLCLSILIKQNGIFFILTGIFYTTYYYRKNIFHKKIILLKKISFLSAGIILPAAITFVILYTIGIYNNFIFWTFTYPKAYVSLITAKAAFNLFFNNFGSIIRTGIVIWIFSLLGFALLAFNKIEKEKKIFIILFSILSFISIFPGFYFRRHYFILLIPVASILVGALSNYLFAFTNKLYRKKTFLFIITIFFVFAILQSIYTQRKYLFYFTPKQISKLIYGNNLFYESINIANYIKKHTNPNDKILVLGSEPQIYFYSKRKSVNGFVYMYPMMESHRYALQMQQMFIKSVQHQLPKYIIYVNIFTSWLKTKKSHQNIFYFFDNLIRKKYELVYFIDLLPYTSNHNKTNNTFPKKALYWTDIYKLK